MTTGTLNGAATLVLTAGDVLAIEVDENMQHATLMLSQGNRTLWRSQSLELSPEPSRLRSTSNVGDFLVTAWPAAGAVVVLGNPRAVVLDRNSGALRAEFSLAFTGKESLEIVGLSLSESGERLLITSTKRLWVIDSSLQPLLRYEPRFMLAGLPEGGDFEIVVAEYDFDSDSEIVTQVLPL